MTERAPRQHAFGRAVIVPALGFVIAATLSTVARADYPRQLASDHFLLTYDVGTGPDATSGEYAASVRDALEAAYQILVVKDGFPVPEGPIETDLVMTESGEFGSESMATGEDGQPRPVIEIAVKRGMEDAMANSVVPVSLEDEVKSTAAHELFHVIQDTLALEKRTT